MDNRHIDILRLLLDKMGVKYTRSYLKQLQEAIPLQSKFVGYEDHAETVWRSVGRR